MTSSSSAFRVALWPDVPDDATFLSEILAGGRFSCSTTQEMAQKFFGVGQLTGSAFAMNAGRFAEGLGGGISAEQIIRKRTPFQLFAGFLTCQDEQRWANALAVGDGVVASALSPPTRVGRLFAPAYRLCPECLDDDTKSYGVGHWHVIHQIPAIVRCPRHQIALHDECGNCGIPLGDCRSHTLPGDRCSVCRCRRSAGYLPPSPSEGYRALESLVVRALDGQAAELRPVARVRLIHRVIYQRAGATGIQHAIELFLKFWSVRSTEELAALLGCAVSEQKLLSLFRGVESGTSRSLQAAVVAFALAHADAHEIADCSQSPAGNHSQEMFASAATADADPQLLRELCELAVQTGYPVQGARALAEGQTPGWVGRMGLAAPEVTKRFLLMASPDQQRRYEIRSSKRKRPRAKRPSELADARDVMRTRIREALQKGCQSRGQLMKFDSTAYRWSVRNDQAWLDEALPSVSRKGKSKYGPDAQPRVRRRILEALQSGVKTREELGRSETRSYRWALKNDLQWLNELLPSKASLRQAHLVD
jgi:hypothetical protein